MGKKFFGRRVYELVDDKSLSRDISHEPEGKQNIHATKG